MSDAAWISEFANGDTFDGDTVGTTAGPFLDPATNVSGTVTTTGLTAATVLNSHTNAFGPHTNTTSTSPVFGTSEFWTFNWNTPSQFSAIDLSAGGTEDMFSVTSAAFVGLSITPGSTRVTFDSANGRFTFNSQQIGDNFTSANIYGSAATLPTIPAGTSITFAAVNTGAAVQSMSFSLVPEPATASLIGVAAVGLLYRRRSR